MRTTLLGGITSRTSSGYSRYVLLPSRPLAGWDGGSYGVLECRKATVRHILNMHLNKTVKGITLLVNKIIYANNVWLNQQIIVTSQNYDHPWPIQACINLAILSDPIYNRHRTEVYCCGNKISLQLYFGVYNVLHKSADFRMIRIQLTSLPSESPCKGYVDEVFIRELISVCHCVEVIGRSRPALDLQCDVRGQDRLIQGIWHWKEKII